MKAIILLLVILVPLAIGYAAGRVRLDARRKELNSLRALRTSLFQLSTDQASVGDPFARVVADEINQQIREES